MGNGNLPLKWVRDSFFQRIGFELTPGDRAQAEWEEVDEEKPSPSPSRWLSNGLLLSVP